MAVGVSKEGKNVISRRVIGLTSRVSGEKTHPQSALTAAFSSEKSTTNPSLEAVPRTVMLTL